MTWTATRELIEDAATHGTAVAAFNVITLDHAEAIAAGATEAGTAVLLQLSQNAITYHGAPSRSWPPAARSPPLRRPPSASTSITSRTLTWRTGSSAGARNSASAP